MRSRPKPGHAGGLGLGMAAPQDEDTRFGARGHRRHGRISDRIPAPPGIRTGLPRLDRQRIVEQQHPLPRPMFQIAMRWRRDPQIAAQFLEDIDQRGGLAHTARHGKAQAMRLTRAVIGVLPENDDLDLVKRGLF